MTRPLDLTEQELLTVMTVAISAGAFSREFLNALRVRLETSETDWPCVCR